MGGPFLPSVGEVPSEVTVTRDGDHVVVCGVRLGGRETLALIDQLTTHARDIREELVQRGRELQREALRREWLVGAVAVAELPSGDPVRLLPDGRIDARGPVWYRDVRSTFTALLAACPTPRRLWWVGSRVMHLDGCGCWHTSSLSDARLLPVDERPAGACKRTVRKLAAEVTP